MKLTIILPLLAFSFQVVAAPAPHDTITPTPSSTHTLEADESTLITKRGSPRFSCGQYKFADNTVQEFYSQVWANIPADQMLCRHFKYEFHSKKGQEGTMVAAKVDKGCTCFFYEKPCDPGEGHAERWEGWEGWENYVGTDKKFKGWYCFEQN